MKRVITGALLTALALSASARAAEAGELKVKRQEVFEFSEKPKVKLKGDRVTVSFASKGYCDATVAVENSAGKIVRHLASGVLGGNAPPPFRKNSLRQTVVWDGKDDRGRYIDEKSSHSIRVSLGLKARFERTLYWAPERRATSFKYSGRHSAALAAAPEGVYVYEGGGGDQLRLFDHEGNYLRTVYPFPGDKLGGARGLKWVAFPPDGKRAPFKSDRAQTTLLTSGASMSKAMAVRGRRIALVDSRINWLATDGTTGGKELTGPDVTFPVAMSRVHSFPGGVYQYGPRSMAFSPDGKWLYLTNYRWGNPWREGILAGVARLAVDGGEKPQVFLGTMKKKVSGSGPGRFSAPSSVDCDAQGRVYVSDYLNDRIQVFTPGGKFLKSIKVTRPGLVRVHRKTGEIFAFTWSLTSCYSPALKYDKAPQMSHFGPLKSPKLIAEYSLNVGRVRTPNDWALGRADLDVWAKRPTLWVAKAYVKVYEIKGGKLVLKKDFRKTAKRKVIRPVAPRHGRQRLYVNPASGRLYVGAHQDPAVIHAKGFYKLIEISPDSGKLQLVHLPFDCEDLAFDMDGLAYLRTLDFVARYDPRTWREVPFDYGEERRQTTYQGFRRGKVISGLVAAAGNNSSSQLGGISVSPKGHVIVAFYNPNKPVDRKRSKNVHADRLKKYRPRVFPGRSVQCLIHVWDKHGKLLYEDAVPGGGRSCSVAMDKDDNIYLLANAQTEHGGKLYPNPIVCTLVKLKPGARVVAGGKRPIPLPPSGRPKRPPDVARWHEGGSPVWVAGLKWTFGGVGLDGKRYAKCHCTATSQMALDYFGRSFVGETQRCDVVALDSAGNAILRVGRYGNVDEGVPMVRAGGPAKPRPLGGDEVALFNPKFVAAHTDRRLFVADIGNYRVLSVKLGYHATARVRLKDAAGRPGEGK